MSNKKWTAEQIPDQSGRVVIVTGANSGLGYQDALALARKGAAVVMACRNLEKANIAANQIRQENPRGSVEVIALDLADLDAVRRFVDAFRNRYDRLDVLINNAGVMIPPYGKTVQALEMQFGVNHLGHFALTGLLLDLLISTPQSRVVTVSSSAHHFGKIDFADLNWEKKPYRRSAAYGQSKLANLLFTYELQRRLAQVGKKTIAVAAHPGWTATNLQRHSGIFQFFNRFLAMSAPVGALSTLYAATAPGVHGGEYFGPGGFMEVWGYPQKVRSNGRSHNEEVAARLWAVSEELTGVQYKALAQN